MLMPQLTDCVITVFIHKTNWLKYQKQNLLGLSYGGLLTTLKITVGMVIVVYQDNDKLSRLSAQTTG
jgi:hypothetical protein